MKKTIRSNWQPVTIKSATVYTGVGPGLYSDFPEVEDYVNICQSEFYVF